MPRPSKNALLRLLKSIEADMDRLGLQAQVLRHFLHKKPSRRAAAPKTPDSSGATRRKDPRKDV